MSEYIRRVYGEDIAFAAQQAAEEAAKQATKQATKKQLKRDVARSFDYFSKRLNEEDAIKEVAELFELTVPKVKKMLNLESDL